MLRNAVKDYWTSEQLPIGSYIHAGGNEIKYEANETSAIDPERVMELYENGDISREQFLRCVKIGVTEAKNVLGGDQVADFTVTEVGNKVDIRLSALPVEHEDDEFVMANHKIKRKIKRRVFGGGSKPKVRDAAPSGRAKRKIRTKK